jgi:hypothetical protein
MDAHVVEKPPGVLLWHALRLQEGRRTLAPVCGNDA